MSAPAALIPAALLDTHLVLWAALGSDRLPEGVCRALEDPGFRPCYSVVSLWEVIIKSGLGRADFAVDAAALRRGIKEENLAPNFRISGLGQLVETGIQAERLVTFGD